MKTITPTLGELRQLFKKDVIAFPEVRIHWILYSSFGEDPEKSTISEKFNVSFDPSTKYHPVSADVCGISRIYHYLPDIKCESMSGKISVVLPGHRLLNLTTDEDNMVVSFMPHGINKLAGFPVDHPIVWGQAIFLDVIQKSKSLVDNMKKVLFLNPEDAEPSSRLRCATCQGILLLRDSASENPNSQPVQANHLICPDCLLSATQYYYELEKQIVEHERHQHVGEKADELLEMIDGGITLARNLQEDRLMHEFFMFRSFVLGKFDDPEYLQEASDLLELVKDFADMMDYGRLGRNAQQLASTLSKRAPAVQKPKPVVKAISSKPVVKPSIPPVKTPLASIPPTPSTPPIPSPPTPSPSSGLDFVMPDDIVLDEDSLALGEALQYEPELENNSDKGADASSNQLTFIPPEEIQSDEEALALGEALEFEPELENLLPSTPSPPTPSPPPSKIAPQIKNIPLAVPPIPAPPKRTPPPAPSEAENHPSSKFKLQTKERVVEANLRVKSLTDIAIETIPGAENKISAISPSKLQIPKIPKRNSSPTPSDIQTSDARIASQADTGMKTSSTKSPERVYFQDDGKDDDDFAIPSMPKRKPLELPKIERPTEKPQVRLVSPIPSLNLEVGILTPTEDEPPIPPELSDTIENDLPPVQTPILQPEPPVEMYETELEPMDEGGEFESMLFFGVPKDSSPPQPTPKGADLFQVFNVSKSTIKEKKPKKVRTKPTSKKTSKKPIVSFDDRDISPLPPSPEEITIPEIPPQKTRKPILPIVKPPVSTSPLSAPPVPARSASTRVEPTPPLRKGIRIHQKRVEFCPMCGKVAQKCTCGYMSTKSN